MIMMTSDAFRTTTTTTTPVVRSLPLLAQQHESGVFTEPRYRIHYHSCFVCRGQKVIMQIRPRNVFSRLTWTTILLVAAASPVVTLALAAAAAVVPPPPQRTVLVTGGAGYIGSHTCLELLAAAQNGGKYEYKVIVVDNLDNSCEESLKRVQRLTSSAANTDRLVFRKVDIRDQAGLERVLQEFPDVSSCIHFAGKKAVGESVAQPLAYYHCNICGTVNLLQVLQAANVKNVVFSSSATVYGDPELLPVTESARLTATNPYGRTKLFIEEILRDCHAADASWNTLILRYFNPIGAHPSGEIGEDPQGIPNNLMPFIAQVCVGRREKLSVFGNDYDTPDGTGVRDYIHVVDLAKGHVAALDKLYENPSLGCQAVNLGTGHGVSVLELVNGMGAATGKPVPYEMAPRRPGDVAAVYADASLAHALLSWKATLGVEEMCRDTWNWQKNNPLGYQVPTAAEEALVEQTQK
jgi:UDP-glucose 4-epimerase